MITKTLTIALLISILSTGCTPLIEQVSSQRANKTIQTNNELVYDFIQPRRSTLAPANNKNKQQHNYYSATGYKCRNITLTNQPKTACLINNTWQESAPIFNSNKAK